MKRTRPLVFVVSLGFMLTAAMVLQGNAAYGRSESVATCGDSWHVVGSSIANVLWFGVAARTRDDVWVVGEREKGGTSHPLIRHFDGSSWRTVPSPDVPGGELRAVAAITRSDVWAVGDTGSGSLAEHWDGAAWSVVPTVAGPFVLYDVTAVSSTDVWAVGNVVQHWNGVKWIRVAAPVEGLSVRHSDTQVYVTYGDGAMLWTGSGWKMIPLGERASSSFLYDLVVESAGKLTGVGDVGTGSQISAQAFQHVTRGWSTTGLTVAPVSGLFSVVRSGQNLWAVGSQGISSSDMQPLIEERVGNTNFGWKIVAAPDTPNAQLSRIAAAPDRSQLWAVGGFFAGTGSSLIETICP